MKLVQNSSVSNWVVLLVDDEPDSIEVASDVLEFHGATVHTASNGLLALEASPDGSPVAAGAMNCSQGTRGHETTAAFDLRHRKSWQTGLDNL